jgi:hypothetical protein
MVFGINRYLRIHTEKCMNCSTLESGREAESVKKLNNLFKSYD